MDVLFTFKIKIESQNLEYGLTKDQWLNPNQYQDAKFQSGTSSILQSPKSGLIGHGCSLHLQIKIDDKYLEDGHIKDHWPYLNHDQDANPWSRTSSILQSPKSGPKGHRCYLQLQNQDRESKLGPWVYQRPVTISKSRSRFWTQVRCLQHPSNLQIRT